HQATGVLLEVTMGDTDGLATGQPHRTAGADGARVLTDLVVLRRVRVEAVLAIERRGLRDLGAQREGERHGQVQGAFVEAGEGTGQAQADRTDRLVGRHVPAAEAATAEELRLGPQGEVNLEADDRPSHALRVYPRGRAIMPPWSRWSWRRSPCPVT